MCRNGPVFSMVLMMVGFVQCSQMQMIQNGFNAVAEQNVQNETVLLLMGTDKNETEPGNSTQFMNETDVGSVDFHSNDSENRAAPKMQPVQIGTWVVFGCSINDETWTCDLRRVITTPQFGLVDTLKFTMHGNKALTVANMKSRCANPVQDLEVRILVNCPKPRDDKKPCKAELNEKLVYFHFGFVFAIGWMFTMLAIVACIRNICKTKKGGVTLISARKL